MEHTRISEEVARTLKLRIYIIKQEESEGRSIRQEGQVRKVRQIAAQTCAFRLMKIG